MTDHVHELAPGESCPTCGRKVPKKKSDAATGPKRSRLSIMEPVGEEGLLEELAIAVVAKYRGQWPVDFAAMREGVGLEVVGSSGWLWRALHFSLYATLQVSGLAPTEEG